MCSLAVCAARSALSSVGSALRASGVLWAPQGSGACRASRCHPRSPAYPSAPRSPLRQPGRASCPSSLLLRRGASRSAHWTTRHHGSQTGTQARHSHHCPQHHHGQAHEAPKRRCRCSSRRHNRLRMSRRFTVGTWQRFCIESCLGYSHVLAVLARRRRGYFRQS